MRQTKRQLEALAALNLDLFRTERIEVPAPATLYTKIQEEAGPVASAVSFVGQERVPADFPELPPIKELYHLFDQYNWMYFEGRLPKPVIEYSNRMTSAGSCVPRRRLIRIGRKYHKLFPEEIGDTLKHEMIHLVHLNHDAAFRAEARRIGASIKARSHPKLQRPPKFVYECPSCGTEYPRQKRLVMASCGTCSRGRVYDERFKLRLKSSPRNRPRSDKRRPETVEMTGASAKSA